MVEKIDDVKCNKTQSLFVIIVRNLSINVYNKRKRTKLTLLDEQLESISVESDLDEYLIKLEKAKWIAEKLEELNPTYADVLTLKFYYEYTNEEISKLIGITEGNVRVRIHRAKLAIKELIEQGADYVGYC